jgi:hypothetical protein
MADRDKGRDKGTDVDKLLAEVDSMLSGSPAVVPAARGSSETDAGSRVGGLAGRLRAAALSGVGAAVLVWFVFAVLPFLGAFSGAAGAFVGAFLAVLVFRRR